MNSGSVVLFDGVCSFCNGAVRFIARNDPHGRLAFASLQSPLGGELLAASGPPRADATPEADSIVLIALGRRYTLSDAVLHIALELRFPWPLAFALVLLPRRTRDAAYRWIARNRYRWFGRLDACPIPPADIRARFLDAADCGAS